jgi:hypothetical protein
MRLLQAVFAIAATAWAQGGPDAVLERARARIQELTKRLDRYVCVETVDRSYFSPVSTTPSPAESPTCPASAPPRLENQYELVSTDRLRVEVTVSQSRELHSWPGATGFDTRDIDQLIANGPVSTGSFALYLSTIFGRPGVLFHYEGEEVTDGRRKLRYQYRAPVETSRFKLRAGGAWAPLGFEGEFWIDPETLELGRLTVRASEAPAETGICGVASTLEYHTLQIGDGKVILPRRSQLEILYRSGRASRNDTMFSGCREYQAESELLFDAPNAQADEAAGPAGRTHVPLPLGLPVTLALQDPIDSGSAATGDAVSARVVRAVQKAGAKKDHFTPEPYFLVAIAFNRMDLQGALAPFAARHEPDAALARELDAQLTLRATGIWYWNVGTFLFRSDKERYTIPAGFESQWFTLAVGGPAH